MIVGGPYDPYTPRIIPVFILYAILFPVAFILAFKLMRKGRQQGIKSAQYLGYSFLSFGAAILIAFIGLLNVIIVGEFREIYRLSVPLSYSIGMVGTLFLLLFGFSLFGFQKKMAVLFAVWTGITFVLVNLDSNWYGVPHSTYAGQFSMRFYSSLSMMLLAVGIYLYLISKINSLQIDKPLVKFGYKLIVWSLISLIFFWACVTLDTVYINITGEGFSIFFDIAWIFGLIFWVLSYIGLTMPPKLKPYLEKRILHNRT